MTTDNRRKFLYDSLLETLTSETGAGSGLETAKLYDGYGSEWLAVDGDLDLHHLVSDIIRWTES